MSIKIDEYLSYTGALSETAFKAVSSAETGSAANKQDYDSCVLTAGDSETALPCENYNDILRVMQSAKTEGNGTSDSSGASAESGAVSGGGGDDTDEEETTKIVTVDGVTYLETTKVSDGVTSVQRTVISGKNR